MVIGVGSFRAEEMRNSVESSLRVEIGKEDNSRYEL